MLTIHRTSSFKADLKRCIRRHYPMAELEAVVDTLAAEEKLDPRYKDHALTGDYADFRECHIRSDWLLVYAVDEGNLILTLTRTGTHHDIFGN